MLITDERRRQLTAIVDELVDSKLPIDNPQIERALIAIIETLLEGEKSGQLSRTDGV